MRGPGHTAVQPMSLEAAAPGRGRGASEQPPPPGEEWCWQVRQPHGVGMSRSLERERIGPADGLDARINISQVFSLCTQGWEVRFPMKEKLLEVPVRGQA